MTSTHEKIETTTYVFVLFGVVLIQAYITCNTAKNLVVKMSSSHLEFKELWTVILAPVDLLKKFSWSFITFKFYQEGRKQIDEKKIGKLYTILDAFLILCLLLLFAWTCCDECLELVASRQIYNYSANDTEIYMARQKIQKHTSLFSMAFFLCISFLRWPFVSIMRCCSNSNIHIKDELKSYDGLNKHVLFRSCMLVEVVVSSKYN
uniref:EXS domain-containing protein n=1 Tax=Ditylenchus dipsaci TaxID=166011 RepID=A0A915DXE0_9BILA